MAGGTRYFVEEDSPRPLRERIGRKIRTLATRSWFGLYPVAQQRRFAVRSSADAPLDLFRALDAAGGMTRGTSLPYVMARVLEAPGDLDAVRRRRGSEHHETRDVRPGTRLALVLEDWFHMPGPKGAPDVIEPQYVTVDLDAKGDDEPSHPWIVEVGWQFVFRDGWILRPEAIDVLPTRIRTQGELEPFDIVKDIRGA